MKPGTLVKLSGRPDRPAGAFDHIKKCWFNILPEHMGIYIKTIHREKTTGGGFYYIDLILVEDNLLEVAPGIMHPLKIED